MMVRTLLPPGFRFHPTDVELVMYYLKRKVMGKKLHFEAITELNIYKFSPWDLPDKCCLKSKDLEWYFFCPREKKYASGLRMNRATETGYWKTTGKDRPVNYNGNGVGMVRTLVFHQGSAPNGKRTDWVIHEYRIEDKSLADKEIVQDAYVLCKVFHKNGPGPKNGAQYGAPFREEDWDNDSAFPVDSLSPDGPSSLVLKLQQNQNSSSSLSIVDLGHISGLPISEPGPSVVRHSMDDVLLDGQNGSVGTRIVDPANVSGWSLREAGVSSASHSAHDMMLDTQNDDIVHLLDSFLDDGPVFLHGDANNEVAHLGQGREIQTVPNFHASDPFSGLEDLNNLAEPNRGGLSLSDTAFLELDDLNDPLSFSAASCEIGGIQSSGLYRPCNFSRSEHSLTGSLCTHYDTNSDLSQCRHCADFPGYYPRLRDSIHLPSMYNLSDIQWNSATGVPAGNVYNCTNPPYNLNLTSYKQEETRNAAGKPERGVQQRKIFSRLQLLLESIPADPASAAFDGSSILAKAEVTYMLIKCTKDALSATLEESTFVYSCLLNLHGTQFQKTLADCSKGSFLLASASICPNDMACYRASQVFVGLLWLV